MFGEPRAPEHCTSKSTTVSLQTTLEPLWKGSLSARLAPIRKAALPQGPDAWAGVHAEASALLADLPPHMLDLRPFWQRLLREKGTKHLKNARIDSSAVARALFETPHRPPPRATTRQAQRLAAGKLLAAERALFKRR